MPLPRSLIAVLLCVAGCAARTAVPIPMAQPGDDQLTCGQLRDQIVANRAAVIEMVRKDKEVEQGNVAKHVTLALFAPLGGLLAAAATDLSNAEQVRGRSLVDRNDRLITLSRTKGCPEP